MNRYAFTAALAALTLTSGAAFGQTADQMIVKVGDLNLGTAPGVVIAHSRIDNAAAKFCGGELSRDIDQRLEQQKCVAHMTGQADSQLKVLVATARTPQNGIIVASRTGR